MMIRSRTLWVLFLGGALVLSLSACGIFGGNDDGGASLDGDLSYHVEGESGVTVQISQETWDGESYNFSTVESVELSGGSASGDLADGDYEGFRLQASPFGEDTPSSLTLQLRSDGDVLEETSEPTDNIWIVEVGEFPDFEEL